MYRILNYLLYIVLIILLLLVWFIIILFKNAKYWEKKKVKHISPWAALKNLVEFFTKPKSLIENIEYIYYLYPDEKFFGGHQFNRPMVLIRDPEMIKQVCVKNFDNFMNHTVLFEENLDPLLGKNLISLNGQRWKDMRSTLSPAFTSSKMRTMYKLIKDCAEQFCNYFQEEAKKENGVCEVEMKDIYTRYATDVIATSAFGITCDSLRNKENEFYKTGKTISNLRGILPTIKLILFALVPKVMKSFKITLMGDKMNSFFRNIIKNNMIYREENNVVRPDMIHLLMEAQKGRLMHEKQNDDDAGYATVEESNVGKEENKDKPPLTDDDITAQAILFFLAGYETSSTLLSFLSHEIAVNVDIQKKLQDEIDETFEKCKGDIDYETLLKMKYLDMVISECLRKWPPGPITERICSQDYTLTDGDTTLVIEKGQSIWMPVYSLHHDPKYFPDPDKFDPERFSDENKKNIIPFTYMPFGQGPRNCIGSRFALLEMKTLLAYLLKNFDLVVIEKTQVPLKLEKTSFAIKPEKDFWLGLKPRK